MEIENQREFRGIWIPKDIWFDELLNMNEKFYLGIYQTKIGFGYGDILSIKLTDEIMSQVISKKTLQKIKKDLIDRGLLKEVKDSYSAKVIVLENKFKGFTCEWCGQKTIAIQKHHFPISKSNGGNETVSICPNCHYEFHLIMNNKEM